MKLSRPIPLLALTLGCNSVLGINEHTVSSGAGASGRGAVNHAGNAGRGSGGGLGDSPNTTGGSVSLGGGGTDSSLVGTTSIGGNAQTGGASRTDLLGTSAAGSPITTISTNGGAQTGGVAGGGASTTGASTGGSSTGGAATGGTTSSVTPACTGASKRVCAGACVDIGVSTTHCGRCDHDCGSGTCSVGVCQAMTLYTASLPVTAVAVSNTEAYFATNDDVNYVAKLLACPKEGCALTPRQVATMKWDIGPIAWVKDGGSTSGTVVFESAPTQSTVRPAFYPCPDSGCPATPSSVTSDGLGSFENKFVVVGSNVYYSSDHLQLNALTCNAGSCTNGTTLGVGKFRPFTSNGTTTYFIDSYDTANGHNGYILGCDLSQTPPCVPATVLASNVSSAMDLQIVDNALFWLLPGRDGFNEGKIASCLLPGCTTVSDIAKGLNSPTEMLADSNGVYVIDAAGKIQRCTSTTCSGGIQDWTSGTAPRHLASDANFVYWADGAVVRRIAK